ncbi:MAG: aldehyde ferredoxin oxidoreductase family protein [Actinomycetota bacterium]|nr:aldehyde ferredoxin oxidoreductase family protein [Actinomycetota bacterium]
MESKYGGYMGRFLDIDLSEGKISDYEVSDRIRELYLGGKGLAARILYDELKSGIDPLGPDNVLIVNTGPLVNSGAPTSNRFNVSTKSPLTGAILSSNSGGSFGLYLKRAGFDGIIIRGKAEKPTWIHVEEGKAELRDASHLWGLDTEKTQKELPAKAGKMVIGPAGENGVLYAGIFSQERTAGRGGAGAVMGSKNLKAVTAYGKGKAPVANEEKFQEDVKKWIKILKSHPTTGETLPAYGTTVFVNRCNATNTLPTHNFSLGSFEQAEKTSGEALADTLLVKNYGCVGCVVKCGRRVLVNGKEVKGPEYETAGLFGANLENSDLEKICEWNYLSDLMGMDTISVGNTIGFAMELNEKGLWKTGLSFGNTEGIGELIEDIAYKRGIGAELALGTRRLAAKYGGWEFAMNAKGMELAAYEPRGAFGHALGYAVGNRGGCHLAGGYMIYLEANGPLTMNPLTDRAKPQFTTFLQTMLDAISNTGSCGFTLFPLIPAIAFKLNPHGTIYRIISKSMEFLGPAVELLVRFPNLLKLVPPMSLMQHPKVLTDLTGMKVTLRTFIEIGERTFLVERMFNLREGFSTKDDTLPERSTKELQGGNPKAIVPLKKMLPRYYRTRGLDARGFPFEKTLKRLEMDIR